MHESEDYSSKMYVENYLRKLFYSRNDLEAIYLYVVKEQKYYAITKENYNITVRTGTNAGIAEQPWYEKAMASPLQSCVSVLCRARMQSISAIRVDTEHQLYGLSSGNAFDLAASRRRCFPFTSTLRSRMRL